MDPQDRRAQLAARNAVLREQVDSLLAGVNRQAAALKAAQAQVAEVTGRATSPDGLVTVLVNAAGIVTDVTFAPSAFTRSSPEKLARSVVAVVQQAAADARQQVDAMMAPVCSNLLDLPDLFPGAPSLQDLLPEPASATHQPPRPTMDRAETVDPAAVDPEEMDPEEEDFSHRSVLRGGPR